MMYISQPATSEMTMEDIIQVLLEDFKKEHPRHQWWSSRSENMASKPLEERMAYLNEFQKEEKIHEKFEQELEQTYKKELFKFLDIVDHPKADMLFELAKKYHEPDNEYTSEGIETYYFYSIYYIANDLVKLIKD